MKRIILASHGGMSEGMRDTVSMILGDLPYLYVLATLRDEIEPITVGARKLLDSFPKEDQVFILTDVIGGSVNNNMLTLLPDYPDIHIICGMNIALAIALASNEDEITEEELEECIEEAKMQLIDCSKMIRTAIVEEEDDL